MGTIKVILIVYGTPSFKHWRPYTTVLLIVCSRKTEKINRSGSLHPNQGNGTLSSFFFIYYLSFDILSYFSRLGSIRKDVKQNISRAEERLFFTTCESTFSLFLLFFFLLLLPFFVFCFSPIILSTISLFISRLDLDFKERRLFD